jgi:hypothetical protein
LDLTFYTNTSKKSLSKDGTAEACKFQTSCMQNQTRITLQGSLLEIQKMLKQRFLSYIGTLHFYGADVLNVWVRDEGFTDQSYNDLLSDEMKIRINVLPVNDEPTIIATKDTIAYSKGQICHVDLILERHNEITGLWCASLSESAVPPLSGNDAFSFQDVDVADPAWGNITVNIKVQASNGGWLFFNTTTPRILFVQRTDEQDFAVLSMQGSIEQINGVMPYLRWDADLRFTGYAPLLITILDHENFGGQHCNDVTKGRVCRDLTFTCHSKSAIVPIPDLCIQLNGRSCMQWISAPNDPHVLFPNRQRMSARTVDVTIGAVAECVLPERLNSSEKCKACRLLPEGCNW